MATVRLKPGQHAPSLADIGGLMGPFAAPAAVMGAAEPMLASLGKPVSELLDLILKTPDKTGLPKRLSLTNWDAVKGLLQFIGQRGGSERFSASPAEVDSLIHAGSLEIPQPAQAATEAVRRKIAAALGPSGPPR